MGQAAAGGFRPTTLQGVQGALVEDHVERLVLEERQIHGVLGAAQLG